MCGIFGGSFTPGIQLDKDTLWDLIADMFVLSEARGKEAAGLAVSGIKEISVFKSAGTASKIIRGKEYHHFFDRSFDPYLDNGRVRAPFQFIGHSRLVTNGLESDEANNQPVVSDCTVGVHNGILVNDKELAARLGLKCRSQVDTEVLLRVFDTYLAEPGADLVRALQKTFNQVEGSASVALLVRDQPGLVLATNTGSLSYWAGKVGDGSAVLFASEGSTLETVFRHRHLSQILAKPAITHLKAGGAVCFDEENRDRKFLLSPQPEQKTSPVVSFFKRTKRALFYETARPELKRCSVCILPATFPFIEFDEKGVCGFCRNYKRKAPLGEPALRSFVEPFRSKTGDPDCIVAFSGGRDSSYGLHYLKEVLGLNPIAFTYDWGMVTDLARRNQARICGKLGIEHIVRAADIPQKRRHIRMNIEAWLKRPHLGMIPLFMAGDKQFYHYARSLRKERGINLAFFCGGNEFEQTHFKSGFCGVRENDHGNQLTHLNPMRKIQMGLFYLGQYLRNPAYWNSSIPDTLWAYYSFYIAKDDFSYLYHYIPWNEEEIERTLLNEYKWETAEDTKTTWRIGDGTAAFYNYIYYTVAGFSEHDTFRSHQIRAGILSRSRALELVERDNHPRLDSIQQYAELVGFNCNEVLRRINEIPKLWKTLTPFEALPLAS